MLVFAAILLFSAGICFGQLDPGAWDPYHEDHGLDLGEQATLHTFDEEIRVLVDTQHNFLAIKDLHIFTCFLISLQQSHMSAQEIVDHINENGDTILATEFRPVGQLSYTDVQELFGHRVARFCQHNPTFVAMRYIEP